MSSNGSSSRSNPNENGARENSPTQRSSLEIDTDHNSKTDESLVPTSREMTYFLSTTCLVWLLEPLMSLVDTTFVGWTQGGDGIVQLAAMALAVTLVDTLLYMTFFLAIATTNTVAELMANRQYRQLQETTSRLLGVAFCCGGLVSLATWTVGPVILRVVAGASGESTPELVMLAARYTWLRTLVAPLTVAGMVSQAFCLVTGHTHTVALAVLLASVLNVAGDALLTPSFGVLGAAVATAVSSGSSALLLLRQVYLQMKVWRIKETKVKTPNVDDEELELIPSADGTIWSMQEEPTQLRSRPLPLISLPDRESLSQLLRLSIPLAFNMWAEMGSYSAMTVRASEFGAVSLATQNILIAVFHCLACLADGLGQAAQAFLPASIYPRLQKGPFRQIFIMLLKVGLLSAIASAEIAHGLLSGSSSLLAKDEQIVAQLHLAAPFVVASLCLHPFSAIMEGVVIATRDFGNLVRTYIVTLFVFGTILIYCQSLQSVWGALVVWQFCRLSNFLFWRRNNEAKAVSPAMTIVQ